MTNEEITFWLAVYGAALASIHAYISLHQFLNKIEVSVRGPFTKTLIVGGNFTNQHQTLIEVKINNRNDFKITIDTIRFMAREKGKELVSFTTPNNIKIEPKDSFVCEFEYEGEIQNIGNKKLVAKVKDSLGNVYFSCNRISRLLKMGRIK